MQGRLKGDQLAVHFRALRVVPKVSVYRVGKIYRCRAVGEVDDVALRGEEKNPMGEKVLFKPLYEFSRTRDLGMRFCKL